MDALFFYRHSRFKDVEIFFSLRSIEAHAPWIRKVWIFGDRPQFLTDDTNAVEVVPHGYVARMADFRTPVTNFLLMFYLSSLIPELSHEYLWFCDDFFLLDDLSPETARENRYLEDLANVKVHDRVQQISPSDVLPGDQVLLAGVRESRGFKRVSRKSS